MKKGLFLFLILLVVAASVTPSASAATVSGGVTMVDGVAVDWIDRVVLPPSLKTLYDTLSEGADGDGVADILIEDEYLNDPEYLIVAVTEELSLGGRTLSEVQNEIFDRYEPYMYAVFSAFDRDHPEVFWLTGKWALGSRAKSLGDACTVEIVVSLSETRDKAYPTEQSIRSAIARRDAAIKAITDRFDDTTTADEKIVAFNYALTQRNQYNTSPDLNNLPNDAHECISALDGRIGREGPVCEGYAKAFKVLCDAEQIPCVLVDGIAVNSAGASESHMWNYVQLQGAWYGVDVTWNDPSGGRNAAVSGVENEDWLLVGSDTVIGKQSFLKSHPVRNRVYPDQVAFLNEPSLNRTAWESALTVALAMPSGGFVYNGAEQRPGVTVKYDGQVLLEGRDYTAEYQNATNAGEATVCIKGMGAYSGEVLEHYTIAPKPISLTALVKDKIYDGTKTVALELSLGGIEACDREDVHAVLDTALTPSADVGQNIPVTLTVHLEGASAANYVLTLPTDVTVTVSPREIRVLADAKHLSVGETEVLLTYTVDSETPIVEGESLSGALALGARRADGSYPILQGDLNNQNNPNYHITFVTADVTVASDVRIDDGYTTDDVPRQEEPLSSLLEENLWLLAGIGAGVLLLVVIVACVARKRR